MIPHPKLHPREPALLRKRSRPSNGVDVHSASELADWWDLKTRNRTRRSESVDAHPKLIIAAAAQTGMEFTGVMVFDVLRFGEGAAESYETGRIAPLVQDVFRGMSIAGGVGKLGQIGRIKAGKILNLYANVGGKTCAPIAMGNALRRTGKYLFLSLEEIAAAHGCSLAAIAESGASMASSILALRKLGVAFQVLKALSFENLCARMLGKEGVMMVRLVGSKGGAPHRVILERVGGVVKILDRYGEYANLELRPHVRQCSQGGEFIVDAAADAVCRRGSPLS